MKCVRVYQKNEYYLILRKLLFVTSIKQVDILYSLLDSLHLFNYSATE